MQIGSSGANLTHISQAHPHRVEVRGRDLCNDVMGRLSFTEYFHLLPTGHEPDERQRYFLDLLLVAIAEHGMMPTNVAARMTLAADPNSLQGAVAAGILGCGPVILGTAQECAQLLDKARTDVTAGLGSPQTVTAEIAAAVRASGEKLPGFGHPVHRPVDSRAERILELADTRRVSGDHVWLARCLRDAVADAWQRPLVMNVSMPIAALMLDLGFPAAAVKAVPILARTAGLLAHLAEEQELPVGFLMAAAAEEAIAYEPAAPDEAIAYEPAAPDEAASDQEAGAHGATGSETEQP
jgi:citrate synthase